MQLNDFPDFIKDYIIPQQKGKLFYRCLSCQKEFDAENLFYTCPSCSGVLLLYDRAKTYLKTADGKLWRKIFDYRKMVNVPALKGIFRYYEFIAPFIPLNSIVYLGEGGTPIVAANDFLQSKIGIPFYFKNDGQNPSASFKDRGMASALSYINFLVKEKKKDIITICASTGDTSAAAALYSSYLENIKSAVLLPHKKVTTEQLSQVLGSGAKVFEIVGVFDDCMKVVESLSENYNIALLNSKNAWRILGQETFSYEIAQDFEYDMEKKVIVVPIGNAGNITAILSGFLKFYEAGVIESLPKIVGVQSEHANPVFKYYLEKIDRKRVFKPVTVKPSVAQAAMIGNPVSMPRVIHLVDLYNKTSNRENVFFVEVKEQEIMDFNLLANRNGHIACTQGGESLAGLFQAIKKGFVKKDETAIVDSTAHTLKFANFQNLYFKEKLQDFDITSKKEMINKPEIINIKNVKSATDLNSFKEVEYKKYINDVTLKIAKKLEF